MAINRPMSKKSVQYQEQLDSLLNQYTEHHPDVRALKAIIEELKAEPKTGSGSEEPGLAGTGEMSELTLFIRK